MARLVTAVTRKSAATLARQIARNGVPSVPARPAMRQRGRTARRRYGRAQPSRVSTTKFFVTSRSVRKSAGVPRLASAAVVLARPSGHRRDVWVCGVVSRLARACAKRRRPPIQRTTRRRPAPSPARSDGLAFARAVVSARPAARALRLPRQTASAP